MFRITGMLILLLVTTAAEARPRGVTYAHPDCNVLWPCAGVTGHPRGERIAKQVGFGAARKIYQPRAERKAVTRHATAAPAPVKTAHLPPAAKIVEHPDGCPRRLFCGCGAAERLKTMWGIVVEKPRELWLASNWYRFPRSPPAPGTVAVRRHHVYVIEAVLGNGTVVAYDANSGRGLTRIHVRSLAGYTVVNPRST